MTVKKLLAVFNLKEAYELFKPGNPGAVVGFSKFSEFQPVEVYTIGFKDHEVCCCPLTVKIFCEIM